MELSQQTQTASWLRLARNLKPHSSPLSRPKMAGTGTRALREMVKEMIIGSGGCSEGHPWAAA